MKLRARLLVGVLASALPLSIGLAAVQTRIERTRSLERVADVATVRMSGGMRERCEASPETFPEMPELSSDVFLDDVLGLLDADMTNEVVIAPADPSFRLFAYDASLVSHNPIAPQLDIALVEALERGEQAATVIDRRGAVRVERALVRMPWNEGPCAVLLVEHEAPPPRVLGRVLVPLAVAFAVALSMLLVVGPVVTRIRRLTGAVGRGEGNAIVDVANDEIGELTRAFGLRETRIAAQMTAIEGREEALRKYIANTTHDVLAPVSVLEAQLAEIESLARAGQAVAPELAISALEETHYLAGLVHNLNANARLDAGLVRRDAPTSLSAIIDRAVSRHVPLATRLGVALDHAVPDTEVFVLGDVTLLEQALSNLVGNAVRYNEAGGHVAVLLEVMGRRFRIEVLDDGPGVSEATLSRLGERGFRTTEARTRRPEGMGLGLHIVREVVAAHGFTLEFLQREPSGLCVVVEGPTTDLVP